MDSSKPKVGIYEVVTTRILKILGQGIIPWQLSWHKPGIPRNAITGQPYRAINLWILHSLGFKQNRFLTRTQIASIDASIKQGETGYIVLKRPDIILADNGPESLDQECYELFNIEQCDNLPTSLMVFKAKEQKHPYRICNEIIRNMPKIQKGEAGKESRLLLEVTDCINFPSEESFSTPDGMFASLFHILLHGSGSTDRLNRSYEKERSELDFPVCVMEELMTELGIGYLCSYAGIPIPCTVDRQEYAEALSPLLEIQPSFIVQASMYAQQAIEYILNSPRSTDYVSQEEADQLD